MRVYRLSKARYSDTVLSGQGGLLVDGRWHSVGRPVVYTATSEALAVLEVRVHLRRALPNAAFAIHVIEVPDDAIESLDPAILSPDWNSVPPRTASRTLGDAWLASARSLALRVPSIHSATDANILLNPLHPAARTLEIAGIRPYTFDPRLFT